MVVIKNLAATLPLTLVSLPTGVEDSLRFSFKAASGVGGGSGDGPSSGSTPASPAFTVASKSQAKYEESSKRRDELILQ